ncbi:hypothetical protein [Pseudomonas sp. NPDC007930]|uniref:hypothetical protein n=1 Tax=Pseudomonas sp. NPDC007930 TaxID=3364417 RepID=UPI0036E19019
MSELYESIANLETWFGEKPRTLGWDAIMAVDQAKANQLLLQEYIERFNSSSYLPAITEETKLTGAVQQFLDYRFDHPRVSFENASLENGQVTMTLRAVGGTYLEWKGESVALGSLSTIYQINPLTGHTYTATIELKDNTLTQSRHEVVLDLKDGQRPTLDATASPVEQSLDGNAILLKFKAMADAQTRFPLGYASYGASDLIQPETLRIRSQAAPGAKLANASNAGDGAILMFVAMKGNPAGSLPVEGGDWKYLLQPGSHDAMLVLGHEFIMRSIAGAGAQAMGNIRGAEGGQAAFSPVLTANGAFKQLELNDEAWWQSGNEQDESDGYTVSWNILAFPFNVKELDEGRWLLGELTVKVIDKHLELSWQGQHFRFDTNIRKDNSLEFARGTGSFSYSTPFNMSLQGGKLEFATPFSTDQNITFEKPLDNERTQAFMGALEHRVKNVLLPLVTQAFLGAFKNFNTAHLGNLLFRSQNPLALKGASVPGDMLLWGDVAPALTTLALSPLEPVLSAGASQTFTWGGGTAPTFSLEWADGAGSNTGSITTAGKYTAPSSLEGGRRFARVRVVAKLGNATSYALVTIGLDGVSVNPVVRLLPPGGTTANLSGAALAGGDLQWHAKSGTVSAGTGGKADYTAPAAYDGNVMVDEVTATAGGASATAYQISVKLSSVGLQIDHEKSDFSNGQVSLKVPGTLAAGLKSTSWSVVAGEGTISAFTESSATYQAPSGTPQKPFALVEVSAQALGTTLYGYALIPLPVTLLALA